MFNIIGGKNTNINTIMQFLNVIKTGFVKHLYNTVKIFFQSKKYPVKNKLGKDIDIADQRPDQPKEPKSFSSFPF